MPVEGASIPCAWCKQETGLAELGSFLHPDGVNASKVCLECMDLVKAEDERLLAGGAKVWAEWLAKLPASFLVFRGDIACNKCERAMPYKTESCLHVAGKNYPLCSDCLVKSREISDAVDAYHRQGWEKFIAQRLDKGAAVR